MSSTTKTVYEFGPFRIDMERYVLLRDDQSISLSPKVFETLLFLVQHTGQSVKKDEIISCIWPDTFVEESNLAQNIFLLRKALGEDKNEHRYIVTIPGVGYRFVAPVREFGAQRKQEPTPKRSLGAIAVLPFRNLAFEDGDKYLGPGLADALIMRLSSIRQIKVRPTTAVLNYGSSHQDVLLIGRDLNVDVLLTGVYQCEGDTIRVSVQLVSVNDGVTLWAAKFDERFTDIFGIQDSISEQVVRSLALELSGEEQRQLRKSYTDNAEAFQLYIKGRYFWNQRTTAGLRKALEYAQAAIAVDPTYAPAYVGLADVYSLLGAQHSVLAPRDSFPKARASALTALEIDPSLAEAYASLGFFNCCFAWDWAAAEENYQKAIGLKPNYPTGHHWYGELLATVGRFTESFGQLQIAQELDALSLAINVDLAAAFYYAREYDKSEAQLRNLLELNPNFIRATVILGKVYEQMGEHTKAIQMLRRALELSAEADPVILSMLAHTLAVAGKEAEARKALAELRKAERKRYISAANIAAVYIGLGEKNLAYSLLDQAIENRDIELVWLKVSPIYDPLRADSRFTELVGRVSSALL